MWPVIFIVLRVHYAGSASAARRRRLRAKSVDLALILTLVRASEAEAAIASASGPLAARALGPFSQDFTPDRVCIIDGFVQDGFLDKVALVKFEDFDFAPAGVLVRGEAHDFQPGALEVTDSNVVVHGREHEGAPENTEAIRQSRIEERQHRCTVSTRSAPRDDRSGGGGGEDRKSTRLNSSHLGI